MQDFFSKISAHFLFMLTSSYTLILNSIAVSVFSFPKDIMTLRV